MKAIKVFFWIWLFNYLLIFLIPIIFMGLSHVKYPLDYTYAMGIGVLMGIFWVLSVVFSIVLLIFGFIYIRSISIKQKWACFLPIVLSMAFFIFDVIFFR